MIMAAFPFAAGGLAVTACTILFNLLPIFSQTRIPGSTDITFSQTAENAFVWHHLDQAKAKALRGSPKAPLLMEKLYMIYKNLSRESFIWSYAKRSFVINNEEA
jgi:hypothetical protein